MPTFRRFPRRLLFFGFLGPLLLGLFLVASKSSSFALFFSERFGSRIVPDPSIAQPDLSELQEALRDNDPAERWEAAKDLRHHGQEGLPLLLGATQDKEAWIRSRAVYSLGEISVPASSVLPAIEKALEDENFNVRLSALFALGNLGQAKRPLLQKSFEALGSLRINTLQSLCTFQPGSEACGSLLTYILEGDCYDEIFLAAVELLGVIGERGGSFLRRLTFTRMTELKAPFNGKDTSPIHRSSCASVEDLVSLFTKAFQRSLEAIGPLTPSIRPFFFKELHRGIVCRRFSESEHLHCIVPHPKAPAICNPWARWDLAKQMQETLGKIAQQALPFLIADLQQKDPSIRSRATELLLLIPAASLPALAASLKTGDPEFRERVLRIFEGLGAKATPAIPGLIALLREDWSFRLAASSALRLIGSPAVPALTGLLNDPNAEVRRYAAEALGRIGKAASSALPALTLLLQDKSPEARRAAQEAIESLR